MDESITEHISYDRGYNIGFKEGKQHVIRVYDQDDHSKLQYDLGHNDGYSEGVAKGHQDMERLLETSKDLAWLDGYKAPMKADKWNDIMLSAPMKRKQLIYFHDMTGGPHVGYYFGVDDSYPGENNHVFGGPSGFLTGDATHWMYVPEPPFEDVELNERRDEWLDHMEQAIEETKKPIDLDLD